MMQRDPRRRKILELTHAGEFDGILFLEYRDTETGAEIGMRSAAINSAHREWSLARARDLSKDLCRLSELESLATLAAWPRDLSRMRKWPFLHQAEDAERLMGSRFLFVASEMRTGKSKIVVDATQFMFLEGRLDRVVVIAPAPVRDVWWDPDFGQVAQHRFLGLPTTATEYHARARAWSADLPPAFPKARRLEWFVSSYEWLIGENWKELKGFLGPRTMLVLDESSYVKGHSSQRTKACFELRKRCGYAVELNGTPIFHSPMDLFSQANLLHPGILDCQFVGQFKARYAVREAVLKQGKPMMSPWPKMVDGKKVEVPIERVVGWTNLEDLADRLAPHTVRRLQADCLDLPPKLDPVTFTRPMGAVDWKAYKEMRDGLVSMLEDGTVATAPSAGVKFMRLAQICAGFVGGVEAAVAEPEEEPNWIVEDDSDDLVGALDLRDMGLPFELAEYGREEFERDRFGQTSDDYRETKIKPRPKKIRWLGRAKLDFLLEYMAERLEGEPGFKLVAWCRFRPELGRALEEVRAKFPSVQCAEIRGGQGRAERRAALALLKPETAPEGPVLVLGTIGTGSFGLDFTASHTSLTLTPSYSPGRTAQYGDRVYGPGQTEPVAYVNVIATGPKGQKTVEHAVVAARMAGEDVANWTTARWVTALREE